MNDHKTRFLKLLAQQPRTFEDFTNGTAVNTVLAPHIVERYLSDLVADGFADLTAGVYSITDKGRAAIAAAPVYAPARAYGNYSMPSGSLRLNYPPPARAGADAHQKHKSRGV